MEWQKTHQWHLTWPGEGTENRTGHGGGRYRPRHAGMHGNLRRAGWCAALMSAFVRSHATLHIHGCERLRLISASAKPLEFDTH